MSSRLLVLASLPNPSLSSSHFLPRSRPSPSFSFIQFPSISSLSASSSFLTLFPDPPLALFSWPLDLLKNNPLLRNPTLLPAQIRPISTDLDEAEYRLHNLRRGLVGDVLGAGDYLSPPSSISPLFPTSSPHILSLLPCPCSPNFLTNPTPSPIPHPPSPIPHPPSPIPCPYLPYPNEPHCPHGRHHLAAVLTRHANDLATC